MYLVMEICEGGELADALKTRERMSEEECKIIMSRLASAISYLHKNGTVVTLVSSDSLIKALVLHANEGIVYLSM